MPRGSDAEAAGAELTARTGITPNAEDLIQANQARMTRELRAANNRATDFAATEEMDQGEAQGYVEGDGEAVSWAVRGPFVVVVSEDDDGHLTKEAHPLKGKDKQAERALRTASGGTLRERGEEASPKESSSQPAARATQRRASPATATNE